MQVVDKIKILMAAAAAAAVLTRRLLWRLPRVVVIPLGWVKVAWAWQAGTVCQVVIPIFGRLPQCWPKVVWVAYAQRVRPHLVGSVGMLLQA